jgi:ATP-dependent RNA helicase DOB1
LIKVASDSVIEKKSTTSGISPPPPGDAGRVVIIGAILTTINAISQLRIKLPPDLRSPEQKNTAFKAVGEIKKRMPEGPALLDPIKNMGINDKSFRDLIKVRQFHNYAYNVGD